jgi:hypothetical protein
MFFRETVLRQAISGEIRESASHEVHDVNGYPRMAMSFSIDSDALDLICSALTVADKRPSIQELISHKFFRVSYPEIESSDSENHRFKTVAVLEDMNAGEVATNTAKAMKTLSADTRPHISPDMSAQPVYT